MKFSLLFYFSFANRIKSLPLFKIKYNFNNLRDPSVADASYLIYFKENCKKPQPNSRSRIDWN